MSSSNPLSHTTGSSYFDEEVADHMDALEPKSRGFYSTSRIKAAWITPMASERSDPSFFSSVFAEFWATFFFVFLTTNVANRFGNGTLGITETNTSVSLVFGFAIALGVHTFAHISGAHFNPAVTLSLFVSLHISILRLFAYICIQLLASVAASLVLYVSLPGGLRDLTTLGANTLNSDAGYTAVQGFVYELIGTAFFVLVIYATIDPGKDRTASMGALAIGLAGSVVHFALVPVTGCGINPARSFGPNIIAQALTQNTTVQNSYWIYWVGPLIGGALGGLLYTIAFTADQSRSRGLKAFFKANPKAESVKLSQASD